MKVFYEVEDFKEFKRSILDRIDEINKELEELPEATILNSTNAVQCGLLREKLSLEKIVGNLRMVFNGQIMVLPITRKTK